MTDMAPDVLGGRGRRPQALLRSLLGAALRRIRLSQGRTLADVAGTARISMPYLSEIERGYKEASSEVLAAVCGALGVDLAHLLTAVVYDLTDSGAGSNVRPMPVRRATTPPKSGSGGAVVSLMAA